VTVWITRRAPPEVEDELAGAAGPLAGLKVAVKDNIDVAGMPTTCGCPAFAYTSERDAEVVALLRTAGAVIVGKTNMDQFATGLVGTRSPYGAVADVRRPGHVGGGSSSGSAAAVALAEVDFALGTDTAGSGRVPAAFQRIVGAKPSLGRVSTVGVVPACRSFDCVSVFAGSVELAERVLDVISPGPPDGPAGAPPEPRLATFDRAAVSADGVEICEIDAEPFLAAGALLYGGAFVAERYAAVGDFIEGHMGECDPVVAAIILAGREVSAVGYVRDCARLAALRERALSLLDGFDGLLIPTVPFQPTLAEVEADPIGVNQRLGVYTTFCNLLGLCAYALPSGLSVLAPAGHDRVVADLARLVGGQSRPQEAPAGAIPLLVVGAHMSGMPLNHQLIERGAARLGEVLTAPDYRLFALDTVPAKPGLIRTEAGCGAAIAGELWALSAAGLGSLLAGLPQPMALGRVTLADGREVVGFLCEPAALDGAQEITEFGAWRAFLETDIATLTEISRRSAIASVI
jgi:allophanate hydrolase